MRVLFSSIRLTISPVSERNLLSNIGFFPLNQLSANGKSQPSTSDRKSLIENRRDHYDFMRVSNKTLQRTSNFLRCYGRKFLRFVQLDLFSSLSKQSFQTRRCTSGTKVSSLVIGRSFEFSSAKDFGICSGILLLNSIASFFELNCVEGRKNSADRCKCRTHKIDVFRNEDSYGEDKTYRKHKVNHKFIKVCHFFLRVLGLDFCLTAQILPNAPETNFVRMG